MKRSNLVIMAALSFLGVQMSQAEDLGVVATSCKAEIEKYCADKEHGSGDVRACLNSKKEQLSDACKQALETTGPGKGKGQGKKRGQ